MCKKITLSMLLFTMYLSITATTPHAKEVVNYNNFAQVETNLTAGRILKATGGINKWVHLKKPTPLDRQTIIRMNRDTLYSIAIVDVSKGAIIDVPKVKDRYISIAVMNEQGYTRMVELGGGNYTLNTENIGSDYAFIIMRIFVDADNAEDVKKVNALQEQYKIHAKSAKAFSVKDWDMNAYKKIHTALTELFKVAPDATKMFGKEKEVDPIYFLVGTAGGFGGLPSKNALYFNFNPPKMNTNYMVTFKEMPVRGFWSVTVYNKKGFMFKSEFGETNVNSATAKKSADGTYTIYFGNCEKHKTNCLAIEDGWNGILRLYEPEQELLTDTSAIPRLQIAE